MQISLLFIFLNFCLIKNIGLFYHTLKSVRHVKSHLEAKYNCKTNKILYKIKSKIYCSRNKDCESAETRSQVWMDLRADLSVTCASRNSPWFQQPCAVSLFLLSIVSPFLLSFLICGTWCLDPWSFPYTFTRCENSSILITSLVSASLNKGSSEIESSGGVRTDVSLTSQAENRLSET